MRQVAMSSVSMQLLHLLLFKSPKGVTLHSVEWVCGSTQKSEEAVFFMHFLTTQPLDEP